ncbi:hypothetical protein [Tritonibacter scottomollicae]|uniref:hypothetical protein n=1 Tax=Tritonibacter scottomollicae TaxID=483013 RepID=UPI003BACE9E5
MTKDETVRFVNILKQARKNGSTAKIEIRHLPQNLEDAYAVSQMQVQEAKAWKIGGANPWSRQIFKNTRVFAGPLQHHEVNIGTAPLSITGLNKPLAEPEVMLKMKNPTGRTPSEQFSDMALGFEIPATVLPEELQPVLNAQVSDRAGAGLLWVGQPQPFDAEHFETDFEIAFSKNGDDPVTGSSTNILGGPLGAAEEFLGLAPRYGLSVTSGQWIASGGLCPAVSISAGDQLRLRAWGQDISLSLK